VVYEINPLNPIKLTPQLLDLKPSANIAQRVEETQKLHEQVRDRIARSNTSYQIQANKHKNKMLFQLGDLVWIHLRKECFLTKRKNKLMPRADGLFEILERVNGNAYKVELL